MKFVKAAAYAVVVLVVGATVYSHLILSPGIHHESAAGDRSHPMFHSAGDNIMPVAASFHRPPARPLGTDWAGSASEINCLNQSSCIQSELQVKRQFSIYMCKKVGRHGSRFYYLLSDGLERHPAVTVTEDIDAADLVLFLPSSSPWHKSECTNSSLADRLVIMDEFDGSSAFSPRKSFEELKRDYAHKIVDSKNVMWYFLYFKRSYVHRKDGKFLRYPFLLKKDFFPMVYSIADSYVRPQFNKERSLLLTCTLRGDMKYQPSRLRVLEWVHEYANKHELPLDRVVIGQVNKASRETLSTDYFESMYAAEIIVTANPANWEGDFRLWEALASGALVFVDELSTPMPFPLVHGENVIFFSTHNKSDFLSKLDYYINHKVEREQIAHRGYIHALKYHRTTNAVDYILRSAHVKLMLNNQAPITGVHEGSSGVETSDQQCFGYSECGQKLVYDVKKKTRLL